MTGMSAYELPPGQAIGPYHYENPEEEWLLVLDGRPTLRHPDGEDELKPWDVVFFPPGPTRRLRVALLWLTGRQERLGQRSAMSPERSALQQATPLSKTTSGSCVRARAPFDSGRSASAARRALPLFAPCPTKIEIVTTPKHNLCWISSGGGQPPLLPAWQVP